MGAGSKEALCSASLLAAGLVCCADSVAESVVPVDASAQTLVVATRTAGSVRVEILDRQDWSRFVDGDTEAMQVMAYGESPAALGLPVTTLTTGTGEHARALPAADEIHTIDFGEAEPVWRADAMWPEVGNLRFDVPAEVDCPQIEPLSVDKIAGTGFEIGAFASLNGQVVVVLENGQRWMWSPNAAPRLLGEGEYASTGVTMPDGTTYFAVDGHLWRGQLSDDLQQLEKVTTTTVTPIVTMAAHEGRPHAMTKDGIVYELVQNELQEVLRFEPITTDWETGTFVPDPEGGIWMAYGSLALRIQDGREVDRLVFPGLIDTMAFHPDRGLLTFTGLGDWKLYQKTADGFAAVHADYSHGRSTPDMAVLSDRIIFNAVGLYQLFYNRPSSCALDRQGDFRWIVSGEHGHLAVSRPSAGEVSLVRFAAQ